MPLKCLDQLCQSPPAAQEKPSFLGLTSNKPGIYIFQVIHMYVQVWEHVVSEIYLQMFSLP